MTILFVIVCLAGVVVCAYLLLFVAGFIPYGVVVLTLETVLYGVCCLYC